MERRYSELLRLHTMEERYRYLRLGAKVGEETFGHERYFNQRFYRSAEWKRIRDQVITRDSGCDLGLPGFEIGGKIIVHHINPIRLEDIAEGNTSIFDPEFLICCSEATHNAIHYGEVNLLPGLPMERKPGDTKQW